MGKFSDILEKSGVGEWHGERQERCVDRKAPQARQDKRSQRARNIISWPAAKSLRTLRSKILYPDNGGKCLRTILVTSAMPSEGKSFVSANLGVSIVQGAGRKALLVDCDLRRSSLTKLFGMSIGHSQGLADYLADDKCQVEELLLQTSIDNLSILPGGMPPDNSAKLLASAKMDSFVDELSRRYDDRLIIFDGPPFQVASQSVALAKQVDGVVLVVGCGKSARNHVSNVVEAIGSDKIIGIVFNGVRNNFC